MALWKFDLLNCYRYDALHSTESGPKSICKSGFRGLLRCSIQLNHYVDIVVSRWCVLFSHPSDFTPVCTTEVGRIAQEAIEFFRRGVKLLGHSCDSLQKHRKWLKDIRSYFQNIPLEFPYPIISDETRELAVRLDMLDEQSSWNPHVATTIRALYIIGPDFKVKLSMFYPSSTGRNLQEILRAIDSLLLTERLKVVTPADWTMGKEVIVAPDVLDEDLPRLFPGGVEKISMPSGTAYLRFTSDYGHASECWDGGTV